jgi:hypothetical protein
MLGGANPSIADLMARPPRAEPQARYASKPRAGGEASATAHTFLALVSQLDTSNGVVGYLSAQAFEACPSASASSHPIITP